jgi:hypothetical protein
VDPPQSYVEVLRPPVSWWVMAAGIVVSVWWAFFVAAPAEVALIAAAVTAAAVGGGLSRYGAVRICTDEVGLHAGNALLPWPYVGAVEVLDARRLHEQLGVKADARAHLLIRSYCREAVRVNVDDARDPTPYWVVSTRHPQDLALHLRPRSMQD